MTLTSVLLVLVHLLMLDVLYLLVLLLIIGVLSRTKHAAFAVMRRNFVGYFSNPTGYVFLCIFVFLTSLAAFWPYDFFNQNLATLEQLNRWCPLIMLVFVPAITMSVWAEEKRQGTDELLLTLPVDDFDIVFGKYMSAAGIFTASLIFSQIATFTTLAILTMGQLDTGLIFTTYLGYWFMGLVMLAIGMMASFLTHNLTVGFILGALFNAPLAFASYSGAIIPRGTAARFVTHSGLGRSFDDFGRGIVSLSSVTYFVLVTGIALYVCMVLIGRRHWTGGEKGNSMVWHYLGRTLSLILIVAGMVVVFRHWDFIRVDSTEGKVSSVSPMTKQIIRELDTERPVVIDAFISDEIPEQYARTRYQLVNLLKEFRSEAARAGRVIKVNLRENIELYSNEAELAKKRFSIAPVNRMVREKGTLQQKPLILGAAVRCGLEKVTIPLFEYGIPVEYELVRSIQTVSHGRHRRLGIVTTDALLMGGRMGNQISGTQIPRNPLVDELQKQYEVEPVSLDRPVPYGRYDVLIAVQPSTLSPEKFQHLIASVKQGVPTAIFEDPFPAAPEHKFVTPTGIPKQVIDSQRNKIRVKPKGDMRKLWETLELDVPGTPGEKGTYDPDLAWQRFNPYSKSLPLPVNDLWIFIDNQIPDVENPFSPINPITSGLRQVLVLFGGVVNPTPNSQLKQTPLLTTGANAGKIRGEALRHAWTAGDSKGLMAAEGAPTGPQTIAIAIESAEAKADSNSQQAEKAVLDKSKIKAVYVADIDLMATAFLRIRADPNSYSQVNIQIQNVTFLLNLIDWLAGEEQLIEVRKHQPIVGSLVLIDEIKNKAALELNQRVASFTKELRTLEMQRSEATARKFQKLRTEMEEFSRQGRENGMDVQKLLRIQEQKKREFFQSEHLAANNAKHAEEKIKRQTEKYKMQIARQADLRVERVQNMVKAAAVSLPCIPPLLIGIIVFASSRLRERENISKSRLK